MADADAAPTLDPAEGRTVIDEAAFAIYSTWSRPGVSARARWTNLKPQIRAEFENEARAALKVFEAYRMNEF